MLGASDNYPYRMNPDREGTLLLFPSHLLHKTEPNLSNKSRYCLAFNVFFKGSIGDDQGLNRLDI